MEEGGLDAPMFGMQEMHQWLLSRPLGSHNADDDEEETADAWLEEAQLEGEGLARHSCFRKTLSREVPVEQSRSGRLYQTVQHSALEFSGPTTSIKSRWLSWSSSPRPHPPPPGRSLTSWIPIASSRPSVPQLTNSGSQRMGLGRLALGCLTGKSGTPQTRTSSESYTRETAVPVLRDRSDSLSVCSLKTQNR